MIRSCSFPMKSRRIAEAAALLGLVLASAPAAHAQSAYDVTLRSIAPATITASGFDARARQAIRSIGPSSLENQPGIVPAVYDPSAGRFVSALGNTRGAITVSSSGAVSVIVSNQSSTIVVGGGSSGFPMRSDPVLTPSSTLSGQQVTTSASSSR